MKLRVVPLVIVLLICVVISGCGFLNPLNRLATGEFVLSDVDSDINAPDWLDGTTLIATTGPSTNLIEVRAATGAIRRTHVIDNANITNMNAISASPDASLVVFSVNYEGADYSDILVHNLATEATTNLTNASGSFHGASFLSNTEVVYFEFDDSVADEMSNRLIKYDLTSDQTTEIFENTYPMVGDDIQGDTYWWGQASSEADKVLACTTAYPSGEISFAIFSSVTGDRLFDGFEIGSFTTISRGDWIDENTVIIAYGAGAGSSLAVIDISTGTMVEEFPLVDDRIHRLYGLHVSPDKTMVASHAQELDAEGNHVTNRLIVARIAEAAE